jgi:hypothetical protein
MSATDLLRRDLLQGVSMLVAGPPTAPFAGAIAQAFLDLGARPSICLPDGEDELTIDAAVAQEVPIDMLVVDGAALFGRGGLRACLDAAWNVTRAVVKLAFLPDERGGRIVYLAPAPDAGEHAMAARAGLENLARTLSVEWARHDINVIAIAPGLTTTTAELAALTAFLASPAGIYFSGCLLDLGGVDLGGKDLSGLDLGGGASAPR